MPDVPSGMGSGRTVEDENVEEIEQTEPVEEPPPPPAFRTINSQEELDRVLSERLRRERAKFADYAQLRQKAEEFDRLTEAQKTEAERLTARLTEAEQRVQSLRDRVRERSLRSTVVELSNKLGIVDAEVAMALLGGVEYDDEDAPVGVEERLRDLIKAKPFLRTGRYGSADGGARQEPADLSTVDMETYMARRSRR